MQAFDQEVMGFLRNLAYDSRTDWSGESGDRLLLLVSVVFDHDTVRHKPLNELLTIARNRQRFYDRGHPNLHWRALQVLVALRYSAPRSFWTQFYSSDDERYAGPVVAGLAVNSLEAAVTWACSKLPDEAVLHAFYAVLPWLVEQHGQSEVGKQLTDVGFASRLSPLARSQFESFAERLDIDIIGASTIVVTDLEEKSILKVYDLLDMPRPAEPRPIAALQYTLEMALRDRFRASGYDLSKPNPDVEVIVGMMIAVVNRDSQVPRELQRVVERHCERLLVQLMDKTDQTLLLSAFYVLRTSGMKLDATLCRLQRPPVEVQGS
jgi:hypothetical protein